MRFLILTLFLVTLPAQSHFNLTMLIKKPGGGCSSSGSQAFSYTGANQTFVVPTGCTSVTVKLWGAGGGGTNGQNGGGSGYSTGALAVTSGESLTIIVGGGGGGGPHAAGTYNPGGFGGGGNSGYNNIGYSVAGDSGGGGGRSAIRRGATELATAGGGGGSSTYAASTGGVGGGTNGGNGSVVGDGCGSGTAGSGGTSGSGGSAGESSGRGCSSTVFLAATSGSQYTGGRGEDGIYWSSTYSYNGGGGGGGYYGGGGGGAWGGGGGGSSYIGGLTSASTTAGSGATAANNADPDYSAGVGNGGNNGLGGHGRVVISWIAGGGSQANPTALSLAQTTRNRTFTVSWTAGSGNGGAGGCKLQYHQNGTTWVDLAGTYNCDSTTTNATAAFPTTTNWTNNFNATGVTVRLLRISDSTVMGTFTQKGTCTASAGSGGATPNIDENCNHNWDDYSCDTCWSCNTCDRYSYSTSYTTYPGTTNCTGGTGGGGGGGPYYFNSMASCSASAASYPNCQNDMGAPPSWYTSVSSGCAVNGQYINDCGNCGSSPYSCNCLYY